MVDNIRLRKECKIITNSDNFKAVFGTTNRITPSVIYLKINTWVKYNGEVKNYNSDVDKLNSTIKMLIKREIREQNTFSSVFFYTPNIKKSIANTDNLFHVCFEITLKQNNPMIYDIKLLSDKIELLTNKLIQKIESSTTFEFTLNK